MALLTGKCEFVGCEWCTVQTGYPALVKARNDHLRESHHKKWVWQ